MLLERSWLGFWNLHASQLENFLPTAIFIAVYNSNRSLCMLRPVLRHMPTIPAYTNKGIGKRLSRQLEKTFDASSNHVAASLVTEGTKLFAWD